MSPANLVTAVLAQATAEYVVTTLGRSAHAVGDALDAGWSFVTTNPWTVGAALVVLIFLGRK